MLCERVSLFTNSTRVPCEMFNCVVLTPAEVMVMVVPEEPPPEPPDGEDGVLPPQDAANHRRQIRQACRTPEILSQGPRSHWTMIVPRRAAFESSR